MAALRTVAGTVSAMSLSFLPFYDDSGNMARISSLITTCSLLIQLRKSAEEDATLTAVCTRVSFAGIFSFALQSPSSSCAMFNFFLSSSGHSLVEAAICDAEAEDRLGLSGSGREFVCAFVSKY